MKTHFEIVYRCLGTDNGRRPTRTPWTRTQIRRGSHSGGANWPMQVNIIIIYEKYFRAFRMPIYAVTISVHILFW